MGGDTEKLEPLHFAGGNTQVTWCTGLSSDCCDNTPGRNNLRKAGSFTLTVQGCSRHVRDVMAAGA